MMTHALAKQLGAAGFHVFEIDGKTPARKGWQDRAMRGDLSEWARNWTTGEEYGVGIATGGPYRNGRYLLVLDVDVKKGARGQESLLGLQLANDDLPDTLTVRTKSGGWHYYFWADEPFSSTASNLGPGLDIRCKAGLVVAPGNGGYRADGPMTLDRITPLPEWVKPLLRKPAATEKKPLHSLFTEEPASARPRALAFLQDAEPAVEGAGGNPHTYSVANALMDFGCFPETVFELMAGDWNERCSPPWPFEGLEKVIDNAAIYRTQPIGVKAPEADFELTEIAPEQATASAPPASAGHGWRIFSASDAKVHLDRRDLVRGLIDPASVVAIYGPSNSGKSFLAIHLLGAVSRGAPWFGHATRQGVCLYVGMEGAAGIEKRICAYRDRYGDAPHFYALARPIAITKPDAPDVAALIRCFKELMAKSGLPPGMIALDTVAMAMCGGDENSAEAMSAFAAAVRRVAQETCATVVLIHHPGKDESRGMRGSTALPAAVDTTISVKRSNAGGRLVFEKERDHGKPPALSFSLRQVNLGTNVYGDPVTSCVIEESAASVADDFDPPVDRLTPKLRAAFDAVASAAAEIGRAEGEMVWISRADATNAARVAKGKADKRASAGARAVDDLVKKEALERREVGGRIEIGVPAEYVTPRAAPASHSGQGVGNAVH